MIKHVELLFRQIAKQHGLEIYWQIDTNRPKEKKHQISFQQTKAPAFRLICYCDGTVSDLVTQNIQIYKHRSMDLIGWEFLKQAADEGKQVGTNMQDVNKLHNEVVRFLETVEVCVINLQERMLEAPLGLASRLLDILTQYDLFLTQDINGDHLKQSGQYYALQSSWPQSRPFTISIKNKTVSENININFVRGMQESLQTLTPQDLLWNMAEQHIDPVRYGFAGSSVLNGALILQETAAHAARHLGHIDWAKEQQ